MEKCVDVGRGRGRDGGQRGMEIRMVYGYADGSCFQDSQGIHVGAGVFFADQDQHNRCVPVPKPRPTSSSSSSSNSCDKTDGSMVCCPFDSLRAELYGALLFVYLVYEEKHVPFRTRLVLYQDSVVAMHLLTACKFGSCAELLTMSPSRWALKGATCNGGTQKFTIDYVWGEQVNATTILMYADVLDWWWVYTRNRYAIDLHWVHAHQNQPSDRKSVEWRHWHGNQLADTFAKVGARINRNDRDSLALFVNYPLFRTDTSLNLPPRHYDPKIHYLPLLPHLSDRPTISKSSIVAENTPIGPHPDKQRQ
jgi:hypothetical protein